MGDELTADAFKKRLLALQSDEELRKIQRYFRPGDMAPGDYFIGVRMGSIFELAREFIDMPCSELEALLASDMHEMRVGALSIMGKRATRNKTTVADREALFETYMRCIDRVNNWDLVDLSAHHVIGGYLATRPRDLLYDLARDANPWKRRITIFSTMHFVKAGDLDDAFALCEILANDPHELVQKAVGWVLRTAGDVDRERLSRFLDDHAATAPRTMLRAALEHYTPEDRAKYLAMKSGS